MNETSDNALAWLPAWRLREMFTARELSPLEYAQFLLARVERHIDLGAFITIFPDHLLEQAKQATAQYGRNEKHPPLLGLPVSIKDTVFTKGQRTTLGSKLFEDHIPTEDSVVSEQVKKAGAIIFAKSNTPEFAMNRRSINLVAREAVNPWDTTRTSGGSSGGAAVATAAGLGPLAVGTDGGGSIRIPSAFNGVFGLLPSRGRVPDSGGHFRTSTSGTGPMTRDVHGPLTMRIPPPDYLAGLEDGVRNVRIAWSGDLGRVEPDMPDTVTICHEAALIFRALGADYCEPSIRLEDPHDQLELDAEYSRPLVEQRFRVIMPDYQNPFTWAAKLPPQDYAKLAIYFRDRSDRPNELDYTMSIRPAVRHRPKTRLSELFNRIDLLLTPHHHAHRLRMRAGECDAVAVYGLHPSGERRGVLRHLRPGRVLSGHACGPANYRAAARRRPGPGR
jgi:Asp-tRNA(Asn)/Glu-tRNA(Gln) amidotransferase A subunit family amidase